MAGGRAAVDVARDKKSTDEIACQYIARSKKHQAPTQTEKLHLSLGIRDCSISRPIARTATDLETAVQASARVDDVK